MKLLPSLTLGYILLIWLLNSTSFAQSIAPPSPNASALAKYASTPVNLYTGTPSIQAPLLTLPGRKLNVPVNLSYHASGIKVQDVASSVGLGWALNAGGAITRMVRGLPDEAPEGYSGTNKRGNHLNQEDVTLYGHEFLHNVGSGTWDSEPDIYFFNFMGRAGRFVLDANGDPVIIPYQNLRITKPSTSLNGWEIVIEDGTTFVFGYDENAKETTETTTQKPDGSTKVSTSITAWYLTEIRLPGGQETISFDYEVGSEATATYYNHIEIKTIDNYGSTNATVISTELKALSTGVTTKPSKYLSKITSPLGSIAFTYAHQRQDLAGGVALTDVKLLNKLDQVVKHLALYYSYFSSCTGTECKRLRLDRIEEKAASEIINLYNFSYNTTVNLPARNSPHFDHWGYYNNAGAENFIPEVTYLGVYHDGASRETNTTRTQANLLTKIHFPTGGHTEFVYEPHQYVDNNGNTKYVGGVRIKNIIQYEDESSTGLSKTYHYNNSGLPFETPEYATGMSNLDGSYTLVRYSQTLTNLFDINGAAIGYHIVTEQAADGSSITTTFTDLNTNPDDITEVYIITNAGREPRGTNLTPYPANTSKGWQRGQIDLIEYKDNQGMLIRKEDYIYNFNPAIKKEIKGLAVDERDYYVLGGTTAFLFYIGQYKIISQPYFLTSTTEEQYDQGDITKKVTTMTEYQYDPTYLQLKLVKQVDSEGTEWTTKFTHITDYLQVLGESLGASGNYANWHPNNSQETLALLGMMATHQHSQIIEKTISRKRTGDIESKVVSSELTLYRWPGNDPLSARPYQYLQLTNSEPLSNFNPLVVTKTGEDLYVLTYDNRYQNSMTWDKHDNYSNILQQTGQDGVTTSYLWSYGNSLPIAQVINAAHAKVAFASFENPEVVFKISPFGNFALEGNFIWEEKQEWYHSDSKTGKKAFTGELKREDLPPGNYVLSLWAKKKIGNSTSDISVSGNTAKTAGTEWTYLEWSLSLTALSDLTIQSNGNYLDDIRIYPVGAQMTTFTYDPLIGATSETDVNNISTFYEYDNFNRLKAVKDQNRDLRQLYRYQYKTASNGQ